MTIRRSVLADLPAIADIYAQARQFMRENGNPTQWGDHYPSMELIRADIQSGISHVVLSDAGETVGVFVCFQGNEPLYDRICNGSWLNNAPYAVIHRIAVAQHQRGVASLCYAHAFALCRNVRIDTHQNNIPMQNSLRKNGFTQCGTIYLENGSERIAFQKI